MDRSPLGPAAGGEMTEQLWRLRLKLRGVSRLGSEASLPDFSHLPPPHRHLSDLELTQQFLSQSFRVNVVCPSPHHSGLSSVVPSSECFPSQPVHNNPCPQALPHTALFCVLQSTPLSWDFFFLFNSFIVCRPRRTGLCLFATLVPAVSSETRTVLVLRTICGRNHRAILCGLPALLPHPNHFLHNTQSRVSPSHAPAEALPLCLPTVLRDLAVFPVWLCCPPPTLNSLHSSYADLLLSRPQGLGVFWFICLECFSPSSSDSSSFS